MRAVDIGNEVQARPVVIGCQRQRRHDGAEIRAADADIDDVRDLLARRAFQGAGAHAVGKRTHGIKHGIDVGHDILALDEDGRVGEVAQRRVQHGALFRDVDDLARKHRVALRLDAGVSGKLFQAIKHGVVHRAFGEIEEKVFERDAVAGEPLRIGRKGRPYVCGIGLANDGFQLFDKRVHRRVPRALGRCRLASRFGGRKSRPQMRLPRKN